MAEWGAFLKAIFEDGLLLRKWVPFVPKQRPLEWGWGRKKFKEIAGEAPPGALNPLSLCLEAPLGVSTSFLSCTQMRCRMNTSISTH